jgi:hypothetical protein
MKVPPYIYAESRVPPHRKVPPYIYAESTNVAVNVRGSHHI